MVHVSRATLKVKKGESGGMGPVVWGRRKAVVLEACGTSAQVYIEPLPLPDSEKGCSVH
jgi:hypothetical protein